MLDILPTQKKMIIMCYDRGVRFSVLLSVADSHVTLARCRLQVDPAGKGKEPGGARRACRSVRAATLERPRLPGSQHRTLAKGRAEKTGEGPVFPGEREASVWPHRDGALLSHVCLQHQQRTSTTTWTLRGDDLSVWVHW